MASHKIAAVIAGSGEDPCCCPDECCFFPYPGANDPNTPTSVVIAGVTATRSGDTYAGSPYFLDTSAGQWTILTDDLPGDAVSPCLIGEYVGRLGNPNVIVEDLFPDSLTVNGVDVITRTPLVNKCCWFGDPWTLCYDPIALVFQLNGVDKDPFQDSPIGTYGTDVVA